jgi:hypothetical protein
MIAGFGRRPIRVVGFVHPSWGLVLSLGLLVSITFFASWSAAAEEPASFEYLYIEANEGGSSGGHVAVRFGSNVYHFQNRDHLLVLDRERAHEYLFSYALLSNRSIHISRIGVDRDVESRLASRFRRRHQAQFAQLAVRDALRRDRALLDEAAAPRVRVRGLGYFEAHETIGSAVASEPSAVHPGSPALRSLHARILERYGAMHLVSRRQAIVDSLSSLGREDASAWVVELPTSAYDHPIFAQPWSTRVENRAAALAAIDVLEEARMLDGSARHAPADFDFAIDDETWAALARYQRKLESELVDLAGSRREDWGSAFLIGMARMAAIEASLESGRFVFLDSFPDDAATITPTRLAQRSEVAIRMLDETRAQLHSALRHFARVEDPGELAWERVEERLGRHHELMRAIEGVNDLRLASGHLVPSRSAVHRLPPLRPVGFAASEGERARLAARERAVEDRIEALHRYELITHNCVTATFDTLNDEFADQSDGTRDALGGVVGRARNLSFIPFISAHQVNARYRVLDEKFLPSYRELRLQQMRAEEPGFWLALRESNTLTARAYQRGEGDSFFVFFTEDPVWLRPLLGAVNLVAALGESVWGLVKLPVDRGRTFVSGVKGAFVSLPELAFANIRKGSNDWVEPEFRRLEPQAEKR